MNDQAAYYKPLELIAWQSKNQTSAADETPLAEWEKLRQCVASCVLCPLHLDRTQTVFGNGSTNARLMIIGEAPGAEEDKQGEPFIGRAGQLLTAMLHAIGMQREDAYITNILKCRPQENRDPHVKEIATCTPYLNQQIALMKPQLLLAMGRTAAHYLLNTKQSLESLRGQLHHFGDHSIPLITTYHPAYLLRTPMDKKKAYIDLQFVQKTLTSYV